MIKFRAKTIDSGELVEGFYSSSEIITNYDDYRFGVIGSGDYPIDPTTLELSFDGTNWYREEDDKQNKTQVSNSNDVNSNSFSDNVGSNDTANTISIESEDGTVYEFKTHGYRIKLYDIIEDVVYGVIFTDGDSWYSCEWDISGKSMYCTDESFGIGDYDLTPIKKPWYEVCKYPCLVRDENTEEYFIANDKQDIDYGQCRPATREETLELVVEV